MHSCEPSLFDSPDVLDPSGCDNHSSPSSVGFPQLCLMWEFKIYKEKSREKVKTNIRALTNTT